MKKWCKKVYVTTLYDLSRANLYILLSVADNIFFTQEDSVVQNFKLFLVKNMGFEKKKNNMGFGVWQK